jgi:hypothetical protein
LITQAKGNPGNASQGQGVGLPNYPIYLAFNHTGLRIVTRSRAAWSADSAVLTKPIGDHVGVVGIEG